MNEQCKKIGHLWCHDKSTWKRICWRCGLKHRGQWVDVHGALADELRKITLKEHWLYNDFPDEFQHLINISTEK